jgi:hypothetical protein
MAQIKATNKDVFNRSVLDAVASHEDEKAKTATSNSTVNPTRKISMSDIPEGYNEALGYVKKAQDVLNPKLFEKHPDAIPLYDKIVKMGVERGDVYKQKLPNYYLTEEEQRKYLQDAGLDYEKLKQSKGLVNSFQLKLYPELHRTAGTEEDLSNDLLWGVRSATEYRTDKPNSTTEENLKRDKEYAEYYNKEQVPVRKGFE